MTKRDWFPKDKNEERDEYTCLCCKKKFTAPCDFECEGFCNVCQEHYEPKEY